MFQRQNYYNQINGANASGNAALANQLRSLPIQAAGFSKSVDLTLGGPVYIPKVINGKNKLFYFFNYGWNNELRIGPNGSGLPRFRQREPAAISPAFPWWARSIRFAIRDRRPPGAGRHYIGRRLPGISSPPAESSTLYSVTEITPARTPRRPGRSLLQSHPGRP
jgi:hypothetical protein